MAAHSLLYALIFVLAAFTDRNYLSIAFDSGGVTTGPMTVPFILAMGLGVSMIRSDRSAEADSFGLVALCSIGPILSVLILGFFYNDSEATAGVSAAAFADTREIGSAFISAIPDYMAEMAVALLPIVAIFLIFQLCLLRLHGRPLAKILIGIVYTYVGLVLFLTGVNVGFFRPSARRWARRLPKAEPNGCSFRCRCCSAGSSFPQSLPSAFLKSRSSRSAPARYPAGR